METTKNISLPVLPSAPTDVTAAQCFCRGGEARPTCATRCRRYVPPADVTQANG